MLGLLACAAAFVLPSGQPGAALAPAARAPLAPRVASAPVMEDIKGNFGLTKLKNEGAYFFQMPAPKTVRRRGSKLRPRRRALSVRNSSRNSCRPAAERQLRICRRAAVDPLLSTQFASQRAQPRSPRRSQGPSGRLPGFFTPENFEDMEVSFRAIFVLALGGGAAVGLAAGLLGLY